MRTCASCDRPLAAEHHYCGRCGAAAPAVDGPSGRSAAQEPEPAAVPSAPAVPLRPARYPLFADEAPGAGDPPSGPPPSGPAPVGPPPVRPPEPMAPTIIATAPPPAAGPARGSSRSLLPVAVGVVALALIASVGALLMLSDGDRAADIAGAGSDAPAEPSPDAEPADPQEPEGDPAMAASVTVPATAPPNQDVAGNVVSYEAANMVDGDPETAWRMPDSAAGESVVLRLPQRMRLTRVGLINGYAKSAGRMDWYQGNRRIRKVIWVFDGGRRAVQEFDDAPRLQSMRIRPVVTENVRIKVTRVSAPGPGAASRNFTAISEVSLRGAPAA